MSGVFSGKPDWIGYACLIPPPLFWAGNFIVGRAVRDDITPTALLFWRWLIALVILAPFAWPQFRRDLPLYWSHRWRLIAVSLTGIVAFNAFVYTGLQSTSASNALLLNAFIPLLILLISTIFLGRGLSALQAVGIVISLLGVIIIITKGHPSRLLEIGVSRGDAVISVAMVSWALYTLWLRGFPSEVGRVGLMAAQISIGLLVIAPVYLMSSAGSAEQHLDARALGALAYLGVFPSVVAYLLYNVGVQRVGAAASGLSVHLIPVFGIALAVLFLGEHLQVFHALGIMVIAAGIVAATVLPNHFSRPSSPAKKTS